MIPKNEVERGGCRIIWDQITPRKEEKMKKLMMLGFMLLAGTVLAGPAHAFNGCEDLVVELRSGSGWKMRSADNSVYRNNGLSYCVGGGARTINCRHLTDAPVRAGIEFTKGKMRSVYEIQHHSCWRLPAVQNVPAPKISLITGSDCMQHTYEPAFNGGRAVSRPKSGPPISKHVSEKPLKVIFTPK